jgi:hypothetical protein
MLKDCLGIELRLPMRTWQAGERLPSFAGMAHAGLTLVSQTWIARDTFFRVTASPAR